MNVPSILEPAQLTELLEAPDASTWYGRRDRLVLSLMARCGLRVSEACSLRVDQVRHADDGVTWLMLRQVKATVGTSKKAPRFRNVPCPDDVAELLADWLSRDVPIGSLYVLSNAKGTAKLDRIAAWRTVKRYTDFVGAMVPKTTTDADGVVHTEMVAAWSHVLRHTALTEMLEAGFDLPEVRDIAGHDDLSTTSIYLHARPASMAAKMKGFTRGIKQDK